MRTGELISPIVVGPPAESPAARGRRLGADAARRGLDFLVAHQVTDVTDANHGRYPFVFDCDRGRTRSWTTNWSTGVVAEVLIAGARFFQNEGYLASAARAVAYLRTLQEFRPQRDPMYGAIHEETPQTSWMHPRDGSTAAWAMLDYALITGDDELLDRAARFGDWYVKTAMHAGYPHWTCRFDNDDDQPRWFGSFHSGTAFFLLKLHRVTGDPSFLTAAREILAHYNANHLDATGRVTVIRDRHTGRSLDRLTGDEGTNLSWELMHRYNDDFGALANLAMYHLHGDESARDAALRFLRRMTAEQQPDGGFGPTGMSIPSAAGVILTELMAARAAGLTASEPGVADRAARYLLTCQRPAASPGAGAFLGYTDAYELDGRTANTRAGAYAIMGLLRYAGADDGCYFFGDDHRVDAPKLEV